MKTPPPREGSGQPGSAPAARPGSTAGALWRRRRGRARALRADLLPLLDVIFLLVAVLLLSLVQMVRSYTVPIDLPGAQSGEEQDPSTLMLLAVDAAGQYFAAGEPLGLDGIAERVRRAAAADPELAVLVQADRRALHGQVAALIDRLRLSGAAKVLFVASEEPAGSVELGSKPEGEQ